MALKLFVSWLIDIAGTAAALLAVLAGLLELAAGVLELLLHAAMTRHAATGSAVIATFLALPLALRGAEIIKPPRVCL
jgi:hypothetical protein